MVSNEKKQRALPPPQHLGSSSREWNRWPSLAGQYVNDVNPGHRSTWHVLRHCDSNDDSRHLLSILIQNLVR